MTDTCADCGEPATRQHDWGEDYAWWTRQPRYEPVCESCWRERDNRDSSQEGPTFDDALGAVADTDERLSAARKLK